MSFLIWKHLLQQFQEDVNTSLCMLQFGFAILQRLFKSIDPVL